MPAARGAAAARDATTASRARARRPRVRRRARAGGPRGRRAVVARERHRRRRGAGQGAAAHRRGRRRHLPAGHAAARRRAPCRTACALRTERETILARAGRQRRGLYADEVSRDARRRDVHDLSVPRRVRRARAGEALARQRAGLSAAARVGPRPRRAPGADDRRRRSGSGRRSGIRTARTTTRAIACRSRRSSSRRGGCSTASRSTTCGCRAAASAPSCTRRASRSPIS